MKRVLPNFLLVAPLLAPMLYADFDATHWRWRRTLVIPAPRDVSAFAIDPVLYRGMTIGQADLRIVRDGVETPYVIHTLTDSSHETELRPAILNQGMVPSSGVQVTMELERAGKHNRLRLSTWERNFRQRVRIETADDPEHWTIARDDGYIFDFSKGDRRVAVLTVDYPVSTRRYVRATVFGWTDIHAIESAWLTFYEEHRAVRDILATIKPTRAEEDKTHSTLLTADAGFAGLPANQIRFAVGPANFYRAVEIETSRNGQDWLYVAAGVLSRTPEREELTIDIPEHSGRYRRARIYNGDDKPLPIESLTISGFERVVTFPANASGTFWVYYGNPDARAPTYDFGRIVGEGAPVTVSLGPEQANSLYRAPPPPKKAWSDEHPGLLYTMLGLAVAIMGYVTVRFMLKVPTV
jgi:hypothetical protein